MRNGRGYLVWLIPAATSVALLGLLAAAADWPAGIATLRRASLRWTYLGIGLLLLEGVVTALRFRVLVRGKVRISSCLLANAWSVLLLLVLPARLGEVASVGAIVRYMDQPGGVAVASLLFQRVFDLILLAGLLVLLTILSAGEGPVQVLFPLALAILSALLAVLFGIGQILTFMAALCNRWRRFAPARHLRKVLVQARTFRQREMTRTDLLRLACLTLLKWLCNLAGIAAIVISILPGIEILGAAWISVAYNMAAVIPLQTIGGFGVSEAVLVGGFTMFGYSIATGTPLALAVRAALVSAPLLFWLIVTTTTTLAGRRNQRE